MRKEDMAEKIRGIARETTGAELKAGETLKESGLDSLSLVCVIAGIEERFGFFFEEDDLQPEKLLTLEDLTKLTGKYV